MGEPPAAAHAATLVLIRDAAGGVPPDLVMVERAATMVFASGALVFPGGRVDPGDRALAATAADPDEYAARVAAVRETLEETGIAVALDPPPDDATVSALRAGLAKGKDFAALLAAAGLAFDPQALVPFARWLPDLRERRIFDTRFYLAAAPAGSAPVVDGTENVAALWISAPAALAAAALGERRLIFPTRRNLERLAGFASFATAADDAAAHPVETITPWIEERDGEQWLCIPEGRGYPVTAQPLSEVQRG